MQKVARDRNMIDLLTLVVPGFAIYPEEHGRVIDTNIDPERFVNLERAQ